MSIKNFLSVMAITSIALSSCAQNGVKESIPSDKEIEKKVDKLVQKMTLEEKVGQMVQLTAETFTTDNLVDTAKVRNLVKTYKIGSFLNTFGATSRDRAITAEQIKLIQDITM